MADESSAQQQQADISAVLSQHTHKVLESECCCCVQSEPQPLIANSSCTIHAITPSTTLTVAPASAAAGNMAEALQTMAVQTAVLAVHKATQLKDIAGLCVCAFVAASACVPAYTPQSSISCCPQMPCPHHGMC